MGMSGLRKAAREAAPLPPPIFYAGGAECAARDLSKLLEREIDPAGFKIKTCASYKEDFMPTKVYRWKKLFSR